MGSETKNLTIIERHLQDVLDAYAGVVKPVKVSNESLLRKALGELLDEISNLDGIELNRSLEPHEAEANWDSALSQAQTVWKETAV